MGADPAELIFFREMTPEKFFAEVDQLGLSLEDLRDQPTHDRVFRSALVRFRAESAKAVAADLKLLITDEQALAIARNSLVPEVIADPAPLTTDERALAHELYFHAIKAAVARQGRTVSDRVARGDARKMVRAGERGLTRLQRLGRAAGCLVVLAVLAAAAALTLFAAGLAAAG
jgi:hypothetical protein